jgi:hypothetical protein
MQAPLDLRDLEEAVSDEKLRSLQLLAGAMAFAPLVYLAFGYYFSRTAPVPAKAPDIIVIECLVLVEMILLFGASWLADWNLKRWKLATILERGIYIPKAGGVTVQSRGAIVAYLLRGHCIQRLAMIDAAALIGLFLSMVAGGFLRQDPIWLWALAPCPLATAVILVTFPTKERTQAVFERTLQGRP